jgi:hypothetical protein
MVDYTPGDWALLVRAARSQAVKRLTDAVQAVDGYAEILAQAGRDGDALNARKVHRALAALQPILDDIGTGRD